MVSETKMSTEERAQALLARIASRDATTGVIGLGYVGLPLVELFAKAGFRIMGFDIDPVKIQKLNAGQSYIGHIDSARIAALNAEGKFEATTDFSRLAEVDAILICVPTPLGEHREPDLGPVIKTGEAIGKNIQPGQIVILESTTYPGTTRDVLRPELEASGLKAGVDFFLAYSPEREDPGNAKYTVGSIPKVVGGMGPASAALAQALYARIVVDVIPTSSTEVAEACKILENTYRAVNIALVNELKVLFDRIGIDVWEVIDAAKTKPFGFQAFYPGPGLGGHCLPIDPFYLSWLARKHAMPTRFIELAGEVNRRMPLYVIDRLTAALNDQGLPVRGSKILLLGVAYKKDVDDQRESSSYVLMELLLERGAVLNYNDPHIPVLPKTREHDLPLLESQHLTPELLAAQDAVLIATDHSSYDYDLIVRHAKLVVDTRNATAGVREGREKIHKA